MSEDWLNNLAASGNSIEDIEARAYTIAVPAGHFAVILPITDDPADDGAQIIESAIALHHVTDMLENGEDG